MRLDEIYIKEIEKEESAKYEKEQAQKAKDASITVKEENLPQIKGEKRGKDKKGGKQEKPDAEKDMFPNLADLMNTTVEELREEFFIFQIKKFMGRLAKTVTRYGVTDKEMEKLFHNAKALEMDEIVVAPAFLPACVKQVAKIGGEGFKVGSIIDFPFGESTLKSKLADVKESVKTGVDDVTVMMPTMLICKENINQFKKESAKIGKAYKGNAGIALNASDLDEDQIRLAMKAVNKTKLSHLTFVFGNDTINQVALKMETVMKYKEDKKVFALANVERAEGIMALFTNGVDKILTPFADQIGEELVSRFNVKGVKLK